jgi:hypothetical protein
VPAEAVEWAGQLEAMYLGWAKRKGYDVERIAAVGPAVSDDGVLLLRGPNLGRMLGGEDGLHKLERDGEAAPPPGRGRRKPGPPVYLARVEILRAADAGTDGGETTVRDDGQADGIQVRVLGAEGEARHRDGREGSEDGRARVVAEASEAKSGLAVRVCAVDAERVARMLLCARLARRQAPATSASDDEVVRVYHLGKTQFVHDKRTGTRDGQAKRVLSGGIDRFLLAYLLAHSQVAPAAARRNGHAE